MFSVYRLARPGVPVLLVVLFAGLALAGSTDDPAQAAEAAARSIAAAAEPPSAATLLGEILERNPQLASARGMQAASQEVAPQVGSLPDPRLGVTAFALTPETRVGPVRGSAQLTQMIPSRGKRDLRREVAREGAAVLAHEIGGRSLALVSEARRLLVRLAHIDERLRIVAADLQTLREFEELARARYATGRGLSQGIVKLQAEITRDETRVVAMRAERVELTSRLDQLRDAPQPGAWPEQPALTAPPALQFQRDSLLAAAITAHPDLRAADAAIDRADARTRLARKARQPDLTLGVMYTVVGPRDDAAARIMRPEDDGDDSLAVTAGINLPIRRRSIAAGVREASHARGAAESAREVARNRIEKTLDEILARMPLIEEQWTLFSDVLLPQAEESERATRFGYESGKLEVLDLLDTERVLLEVRLGSARALAEWHLALVNLEEVIATPLRDAATAGGPDEN